MQTLESKRINSNKIKADYAGIIARIISSGSHKKTYFEILYHDTKDNEWHIGYGSYTYKFVENWLIEEFESGYKPIDNAITDLLSRAEAAEEKCVLFEKIVREFQEEIIPGYRTLVEKAESTLLKYSTGESQVKETGNYGDQRTI